VTAEPDPGTVRLFLVARLPKLRYLNLSPVPTREKTVRVMHHYPNSNFYRPSVRPDLFNIWQTKQISSIFKVTGSYFIRSSLHAGGREDVDEALLRAPAGICRRIPQIGTGNVAQYIIDLFLLSQPASQLATQATGKPSCTESVPHVGLSSYVSLVGSLGSSALFGSFSLVSFVGGLQGSLN
jgi:hypothetical protein